MAVFGNYVNFCNRLSPKLWVVGLLLISLIMNIRFLSLGSSSCNTNVSNGHLRVVTNDQLHEFLHDKRFPEGGILSDVGKGSCVCGTDKYCLCTPSLAIDALIEYFDGKELNMVLVRRKDPPKDKIAIPGGFVNVGETVENATIREVKEETNLDVIKMKQFRVYSNPNRDKRRHTVSVVLICTINNIDLIKRGDDAKDVVVIPFNKVLSQDFAFDHRTILEDYFREIASQKI